MRFIHLTLGNWRNFKKVDVPLQRRVFVVGPNASGKSNLLESFRFLRDIADPQGGGFQRAVGMKGRGAVSQVRSLHARSQSDVTIGVMALDGEDRWEYELSFNQDNNRRPIVRRELVKKNERVVRSRPDPDDEKDPALLSQTHLEQVSRNKEFRDLALALSRVRYLHLVPQLVRDPDRSTGLRQDPYGGDFLEQVATAERKKTAHSTSRLNRICEALRVAVPQLEKIQLERDDKGRPHLRGLYKHWRPGAGWQSEEQFSDGTLRLMGLLWALLDGADPLLVEEPELSLHVGVVRHLPGMMARICRKSGRQIFVSTHSAELLSDPGIAPEEVLILKPTNDGTVVFQASSDQQVRALLESGASVADSVLPVTEPPGAQLLFKFAP